MEQPIDNLYVKRDNKNKLTRDILNFIDDNTLNIQKITNRKIRVFGITQKELGSKEIKEALNARKIKSLPALVVNPFGSTIHGVENIKQFFEKLVESYIIKQKQKQKQVPVVKQPEYDDEDRYTSLLRQEMSSTAQDNGPINEDAPTSMHEDEDGGGMDLGSAYRDRLQRRKASAPPAATKAGKSTIPSMPLSAPPPPSSVDPDATGIKNSDVMSSVRKAAKGGGKDQDLEIGFYQNLLEETVC